MKRSRVFLLCWLVFYISFFYGYCVHSAKVFPYNSLHAFEAFLQGDPAENLSLWGKIENDLNIKPSRHIKPSGKETFNLSEYKELEGLKLNSRRKNPIVYLSPDAPRGYRVIYGVFDFEQKLHGAVMLNPEGKLAHIWMIGQEDIGWHSRKDTNVFPHGFEIARDGSIITAYDHGSSLTKYDYCGKVLWRIPGGFHHSIQFEGQDAVWVWKDTPDGTGNKNLVKVDYQSGNILKSISMIDVMKINGDIDIFGIRQFDESTVSIFVAEGGGPWHPNDIDPLPAQLAPNYRDFQAGDLMLSLRSPDLVLVIDPDTLKVKWWRQGLVRRQHDPDWNKWGTITIFNNNMNRGASSIVEIDPITYKHNVILDGKPYGFYSSRRGKHQMLDNRGVLVTSTEQGRVFETDAKGSITFEFINRYGDNHDALVISEAKFLPEDYFKGLPQCDQ